MTCILILEACVNVSERSKVATVWPELQLRHRFDYSFHKFAKRVGCPGLEKVYNARDVCEKTKKNVFPECERPGFSLIACTTHVS